MLRGPGAIPRDNAARGDEARVVGERVGECRVVVWRERAENGAGQLLIARMATCGDFSVETAGAGLWVARHGFAACSQSECSLPKGQAS